MMRTRTISVTIARPASEVYAFAADPAQLPHWVQSFCLSVKKAGDQWLMETPDGWVGVEFAPTNAFGVLDHVITLPSGQTSLNPMRVVSNGAGSELMFTLFQRPGMSDQRFAEDAQMVQSDLQSLKSLLESESPSQNSM